MLHENYFVLSISNEIVIDINTMLCPIKSNSNTIKFTVHTSCYFVLNLLCVICFSSFSKESMGIQGGRGAKEVLSTLVVHLFEGFGYPFKCVGVFFGKKGKKIPYCISRK